MIDVYPLTVAQADESGLSDSEVTAYTNIVDAYQKRLGRAV